MPVILYIFMFPSSKILLFEKEPLMTEIKRYISFYAVEVEYFGGQQDLLIVNIE